MTLQKKHRTIRFFIGLLSTVALTPCAAEKTPDTFTKDSPQQYIIAQGDTLWGAFKKLNLPSHAWPTILATNPQIKDLNKVQPGDIIYLTRKVDKTKPAANPSSPSLASKINGFIDDMVKKHAFNRTALEALFQTVEIKAPIIKAISKPAEKRLVWHQYKEIFLTPKRIQQGVSFWKKHESELSRVEQKYGVSAKIIVAIIGVETYYGKITGKHRVIDALATIAFGYPKRETFFTNELKQFLILCRDEAIDPLIPTGSYAGAMGIPQFMPSSFISYAADFDGDKKRDIWSNYGDVFASIANYFIRHHWQPDQPVAFKIQHKTNAFNRALSKGLRPDTTVAALKERNLHLAFPEQLNFTDRVKLLRFQQKETLDLWLGLQNFYAITRYNHSPLYAMAVFQLSEAINTLKIAHD
jgi:membrane-bound lytic murein transglycosylase B